MPNVRPLRAPARLALAAALALAACRPPRTPPPDLSLDAAALRDQVLRSQARLRSVSGTARVGVDAPGGSGTVSQFVAAERPDRVHLEVLDFFGNVTVVLVAGEGRFALYDAREKVLYRGAATPENLARLLPVPIPAEDLVAILLGTAPLVDGTPTAAVPGAGFVTLELARGALTQALRVGSDAVVERSSRRVAGGPGPGTYDLRFEIFQQRAGVWFPRQVALRADSPKVKLDLAWKDAEVNGEIDPKLFRLEPPRGARVVDLGGDEVLPGTPPNPFLPPAGADPAGSAPAGGGPPGRE
ncbi:lipoprotein insertase outer membrane protein LolB [Anaeromyxobacter oryzae]|uniref:DUF4292 domain-containing protein n=1 Tax=Anaeromyxobacter oryzae TaxID=2918170 RepID=A0ABM7WWT7_9BACT|nr:lipoprotein insertase outer membrane protein LolB [Anaeromyxobacter oryzae]BDG03976.1 hypothetical protein AMOR_29720 [Anaeromyxobacter oryzae]